MIWAAGFALVAAALTVVKLAPGASPAGSASSQAAAAAPAPMFPLFARKDGHLYDYEPKGTGGVKASVDLGAGFADATAIIQSNVSAGGTGNDLYYRMEGKLYYTAEEGADTKLLGGGWDTYTCLASVGNMGGTGEPELIGRDSAGALWMYQGKPDGSFEPRIRIGTAGWNGMDRLAGRGDFTGDGKNDLIARGADGTLYIYPGTGNAIEDATLGNRITVGKGWDAYKQIVSTGDNDGDGKADLIASDAAGALWLYKGTGNPSAPFAAKGQIGTSGWAAFDALF
ncbi:FG-GAP-like repeat-containing protein [Streptomyces violascens]|uniref:FG-GAP-like repeat-containing protein n=1 Tax=Streptomyces violascens TaxID=67381 RepID=UPI0036505606